MDDHHDGAENSLPPIVTLTDSDGDDSAGPSKTVKRKVAVLDEEQRLRISLGKRCACKRRCMDKFAPKGVFEELLKFRQHWRQLHKLDQDQVVTGLGLHFWFKLPFLRC